MKGRTSESPHSALSFSPTDFLAPGCLVDIIWPGFPGAQGADRGAPGQRKGILPVQTLDRRWPLPVPKNFLVDLSSRAQISQGFAHRPQPGSSEAQGSMWGWG